MKETEYKIAMVEQKIEYITTHKCDRCGKVLFKQYCAEYTKNHPDLKREWVSYYRVTTGHHDWGNDSVDSIESKDICPSCLINEYSDYVNRSSSIVNNTEYIRISHIRGRIEQENEA